MIEGGAGQILGVQLTGSTSETGAGITYPLPAAVFNIQREYK